MARDRSVERKTHVVFSLSFFFTRRARGVQSNLAVLVKNTSATKGAAEFAAPGLRGRVNKNDTRQRDGEKRPAAYTVWVVNFYKSDEVDAPGRVTHCHDNERQTFRAGVAPLQCGKANMCLECAAARPGQLLQRVIYTPYTLGK